VRALIIDRDLSADSANQDRVNSLGQILNYLD
jgi:hypothetical protein